MWLQRTITFAPRPRGIHLVTGEAAGGDLRGRQSAAILVVGPAVAQARRRPPPAVLYGAHDAKRNSWGNGGVSLG